MNQQSQVIPSAIKIEFVFEPSVETYQEIKDRVVQSFEKQFVIAVIARHNGNISAAARELKMDRKHLHDLAKKHNLR